MNTAHKKTGFKARALVAVLAVFGTVIATTSPASAAPSSWSVQSDNQTPSAAAPNFTWTWNGYQTASAVKCIRVHYSSNADGSGAPAGLAVGTPTVGGTFASSFSAANVSAVEFTATNSTGVTPAAGPKTITWAITSETSATQSNYVTVTTYSDTGCSSVLDPATVGGYSVAPATTVTATVDGTLSFTVGNNAGACNGVNPSAGTSSDDKNVGLGRLSSSAVNFASQTLTLNTNAANGFNVYLRSTNAGPNHFKNVAAGASIADVAGTQASPVSLVAGSAGFGYTASASSTVIASTKFAKVPGSGDVADNVLYGAAGVKTGSGCVGYGAAISGTTPAGSYATQVAYRAVPSY